MEYRGEQVIKKLPAVATCVGNYESCKYEVSMNKNFILSAQGYPLFIVNFMEKILPQINSFMTEAVVK